MAVTAPSTSRLAAGTLSLVPADCRPRVPPGSVRTGIVHLGVGAFHRAHQAVYTEEAIAGAGGDWGTVGVAPRTRTVIDHLAAQDCLFSVTSLDGNGSGTRVIGGMTGVRFAPADPGAVVALLADPAIRVVTLTVTEKAYLLDPASGRLLPDDALLADLTTDRPPSTVPGLLVRGLLVRARADAGPLALVSCDNLPANGRRLAGLVRGALELAATHGTASNAAIAWVHDNVRFPGTTIDRIVPASTPQTLSQAADALGVLDLAAVAAEPYRQWVIEDDFPGGRPAWEKAGAILTDDATPWEQLKLRALNGVHSTLAYLGAVAGCETIADALALPNLTAVLRRFLADDIAPSLTPPPGVSVIHYGDSVLERFANPVICHRTLQVAMDGTQKLPQRVLHGMQVRRAAGAVPRWSALVVAAWMRFAMGHGDDGRPLPLDDPLADAVHAVIAGTDGSPDAVVDALLGLDAVFPPNLAEDPVVRALVVDWLARLTRDGVRATIRAADGGP